MVYFLSITPPLPRQLIPNGFLDFVTQLPPNASHFLRLLSIRNLPHPCPGYNDLQSHRKVTFGERRKMQSVGVDGLMGYKISKAVGCA